MMTQKDFEQINRELRQKGVFDRETREELTDHFSADVESHIALGLEKHLAMNYVLREINRVDLKKINRNAIILKIKKPILMIFLTAFTACLFFFVNNPQLMKQQASPQHSPKAYTAPNIVMASLEEPPYLWPVLSENRHITSGFGEVRSPLSQKMPVHRGVDIKAKIGTPVLAPAAGVVIESGFHKKKGNYITLKHDDIYATKYYHLSKIFAKEGQQIEAGESIGEVGNTGLSTAPHLHYEVVKNGKNVDPKEYLKRT